MTHRLYTEDAAWFELLTVPADYLDEAKVYRRVLSEGATGRVHDVLELGSGGGNNAVHLSEGFSMTLVDLSPAMVELARRRNPDSDHAQGDMRRVRLGRTFDAVFVHDAITYMTTPVDLRAAVETAFVHLRPGGVALFVPKFLHETFAPATRHGGHDGPDGRGVRWLSWCTDPDPDDTAYSVLLTCVFRDTDGSHRVESEEHVNGLFSRAAWTEALTSVGFDGPAFRDSLGATLVIAHRPEATT